MAAPIIRGIALVHGVPEKIQPVEELPEGRVRLRFRQGHSGMVFVKTGDGIRHFIIQRSGGHWIKGPELGRNIRLGENHNDLPHHHLD